MSDSQSKPIIGGPGPVVPSLSAVAETGLTSIYTAKTKADFDTAFDGLFAVPVDVTINGNKSTRAHFKQQLWKEAEGQTSGNVTFKGVVEVPEDPKDPIAVRITRRDCSKIGLHGFLYHRLVLLVCSSPQSLRSFPDPLKEPSSLHSGFRK